MVKDLTDLREELGEEPKIDDVKTYGIGTPQKLLRDKNDLALLNKQFRTFKRSRKFKAAIERGFLEGAGKNKQVFYREGRPVYDSLLLEWGYTKPTASAKNGPKELLMADLTSIVPELETIELYRVLSSKTGKTALRTSECDYELSVVAHREKQVDFNGEIQLVGKLKPHVLEIADKLTERHHQIVRVKNNMITMEREDGEQISAKLTKKKNRLF